MKNKTNYLLIIIFLTILATLVIFFGLRSNSNVLNVNSNGDRDMDILNKLKLTYSDKWSVTNNGTQGVELTDRDSSILITTVQTDGTMTLEQIAESRNNDLKSSKKVISDTTVDLNGITFKRFEYGGLDEENFPSDGLIAYSTLIDNVYLTLIINFPTNGDFSSAEAVVKSIRYN